MTLLWIGLVLMIVIVGVPLTIGQLLPTRFEGQTEHRFDASCDRVWEALQDVERHPMTGKAMKSIEMLASENGLPTWNEDMGHSEIITVKTQALDAPNTLVRTMSSAVVDMDSQWDYHLAAEERGCRVELAGVTHIRGRRWMVGFFRIMMVIGGGVKKGLDIQLDMVAKTLEQDDA